MASRRRSSAPLGGRFPAPRGAAGFTLVELIAVIVIVGVLAALAVPRFVSLGRDTRLAALQAMAGALQSAANLSNQLCAVSANCSIAQENWMGTMHGKSYWMTYGWPDAGDQLNGSQIDALVDASGFTAVLVDWKSTAFYLNGAPTPSTCSVTYVQALNPIYGTAAPGAAYAPYYITVQTAGC